MPVWLCELPVWALAVVASACVLAIAVLTYTLSRRCGSGTPGHTLSPAVVGIVGASWSLLSSFMAHDVWTRAGEAREAVFAEGQALRRVGSLSRSDAAAVHAAAASYAQLVIQDEWPRLARGERSPQAEGAFAAALRAVAGIEPASAHMEAIQAALFAAMEDLEDAREHRLAISRSAMSLLEWLAVLFLGAIAMAGLCWTHADPRLQRIALLLFGAVLSTSLIVLLAHERPFAGQLAVQPDPIVGALPPHP